jgi:hypothetical protein
MNNSIAKQRYISFNLFEAWKQSVSSMKASRLKHGNNSFLASKPMLVISLVFLMLLSGISKAWGQTDYSGVYYIGAVTHGDTPADNFYLCPTVNWKYYKSSSPFYTSYPTDTGMPFLTTYKCRGTAGYDAKEAVWYVEKHPSLDYYYIKHASDNKYLTYNAAFLANLGRVRVHLEATPADDYALFAIRYISSKDSYDIISKYVEDNIAEGNDPDGGRKYLNVNKGNQQSLEGTNADNSQAIMTGGIIGLWTAGSTENTGSGKFYLEPALSIAPPTITNNYTAENTFTITAAEGATIYYTTDGSTPTISDYTGTGTTSVTVNQTESMTVIKAIAKGANDATDPVPTLVTTYYLPVCEKPTIKVSGGTVTITCATAGAAIHYTTDGSPATASSTTYTEPFAKGSASTIRAVATKAGYVISSEGTLMPATQVSSSSEIEDMTGNYILADGFSSTSSIGTSGNPFKGTIDGNMVTISGLNHPLVAYANDATIKNIILDNVSISSGTNVGAICAEATGDTRIYNCGVLATNSTVMTDEDGYTAITSCSSTISGSNYVGGIVGLLDGSSRVINCFSYANVSGGTVGGIVGYNNVATTASNLKTMVMNCMYYGEVSGTSIAPIYNGEKITNDGDDNGVNNFNYFRLESSYIENTTLTKVYNCALGAETRYLQRFEFFRHLLNSNRELAAWWATGSPDNKDEMMKWVLEPSQIGSSTPYPVLKAPGYYPSVVNIDAENAPLATERNKGGKLGTLSVEIQSGSGAVFGAPEGAYITQSRLELNITDKDFDHFNFNYYKVQLPYYNDVGTGNYTGNRVVTGWKIVSVTTDGSVTPYNSFTTGDDAPAYNFADRKCIAKDIYSETNKRVFNQGAYWDVPEGVTGITIQPYWGNAVYLSDAYWDVTYKNSGTDAMVTPVNVDNVGGGQHYGNGEKFNSQTVYTNIGDAIASTALYAGTNEATYSARSVYDYAVVLVGNYHHNSTIAGGGKPYTLTSVDMDGDNEPDYSLMLRFNGRTVFHPVKYDFLNILGLGMAQKTTGGTGSYNLGIIQPKYWFETTNTSLFHVTQFEYDRSDRGAYPYIVQGGVMEQWVSGQNNGAANNTTYFHVGGNVWFKEFHRGTHQDKNLQSKHPPVSVTGGDYDEFYLTGLYTANVASYEDNAECYINGGRFGTVAGAAMEGIGKNGGADDTGNITWQVQNADIREFYAGGINAAKPVTGNLSTTITGGKIDLFCGGPKFGDMSTGKTVTTNATDCIFGTFFGAGYGGNSYSRQAPRNHNNLINFPHNDKDAGNHNSWNDWLDDYYTQSYSATYGGVSTQFSYQFLPMSGNVDNCARIFVEYVKFSLATCRNVTSTLTGCKITGNFYGGGSLGKVDGPVTSTLENCMVNGSVFGAGFSGNLPTVEVDSIGFRVEPYYYEDLGTYRKGVKGATTTYTWEKKKSGDPWIKDTTLYTTENLDDLGTVSGNVTLNILGDQTQIMGDVYGGAAEAKSNTNYYKTSPTDTDLATKTTVNLIGGKIMGDVYGGGLGRLAKDAVGTPGSEGYQAAVEKVEANVGNTVVNLNGMSATEYASNTALYSTWGLAQNEESDPWVVPDETKTENETTTIIRKGCILAGTNQSRANNHGRIFGCNNLMGTPKGSVVVNIYKTNGFEGHERTPSNKLDNIDDNQHSYEVQAVYGGGNLAAYEPDNDADKHTQVNIYGCDDTSIKQVYGGGNAASTPATQVDVYGTYEIEELFGGGNGKDDISKDGGTTFIKNPGANVGFKEYWDEENEIDMVDYDTKEERQGADFIANYVYGTGEAHVNIHGGRIHRVYGGSNTKGNVKTVAVTMLEELNDATGNPCCEFHVDEAYGGGKSAPMDGASRLEMACIPGLKNAYGGAEAADIASDVTLNITNGNFDRVFGGNNVSGTIHGTITVNIEETGCHLITIGQLYGGGNQAAYTGPEILDDENNGTGVFQGPTVNVKSFTSIGDVYGGGYGKTAIVTGDTHVNINVCEGKDFEGNQTKEENRAAIATNWKYIDKNDNNKIKDVTENPGYKTITFSEYLRTDDGGFVDDDDDGNRDVVERSITVFYPKHTPKGDSGIEIGGINNVYGGGNAAKVVGSTHVNIGTVSGDIAFETPTSITDPDERKHQVKGASIAGNVYGGGNEAEVTGNTNVNVGVAQP